MITLQFVIKKPEVIIMLKYQSTWVAQMVKRLPLAQVLISRSWD